MLCLYFIESSIRGEREFQDNQQEQQGSLLQSVHQGLATGRSSILALSQKWPQSPSANMSIMTATSSSSSQWLQPPPNLKQDLRRLGLEYTAADMSLSALYLHELHHRSVVVNTNNGAGGLAGVNQSSRRGYPPPGGNVAIPGTYPFF